MKKLANGLVALAANQGLYNGFLAAGLIWSLVRKQDGFPIRVFFLSCVIVAGIFGAVTAKPSILFVQAVPAIVAQLATILTMSLSLYVRRITSPRNYSSRYCHVSAPSKVLIRRPAMSSGAIILALTAILLSASFSISS